MKDKKPHRNPQSEVQQSIRPVADKYREWQWGVVVDDDFFPDRCGYRHGFFQKLTFMSSTPPVTKIWC